MLLSFYLLKWAVCIMHAAHFLFKISKPGFPGAELLSSPARCRVWIRRVKYPVIVVVINMFRLDRPYAS